MHEMSGYPSLLEPCRRRLPATPSRRSSSPRMLPTPPPVSPDFRPPSSLLERRPSGRKLPMPPTVSDTEWPLSSPPAPRKFSEMREPFTTLVCTHSSLAHQRCSLDQSVGTPCSTNAPSQSSSVSHSIEQLTSKSSSDTEDPSAHGIDPTLYQPGTATSSNSVPDIANTAAVPTSSSWPEGEPRPTGLGLIHCSLQHFPIRKRLRVSILKAEGLAGQLKPELEIHAFCKLSILPGGKSQNSIVKRGRDVVFNQEFFFDGITSEDLDEKCLSITVCHQSMQKLQKDVVIGDLYLPLKNLSELRSKKEVRVIEELKHRINSKKLGKLYISSCIEKDARRLTITIIKADDLPKGGITGPPDVCIRIKVTQGGMSQTKQSRVLKSTCCAVYKEAVMFLINTKLNELHQTSIVISVHDLSRTTTGDDLIGSAFLGVNAVDKSEMEQWKNTIEHQGKEYKGVHHLKPAPRAPDVHVAEAPSDSD
uniref:C2 domain-containing protein n=1 Tax=Ascaris lumbricoides TaxID=6252 RepID=A0A9J2PGU0_ASCLU